MPIETRTEARGGIPSEPVIVRRYPTPAASIGLLLMRIPLGAYFILAAIAKFRMEGGVGKFVEYQLPTATRFMSEHLARMFLQSLPYAEIVLGGLLILGFLTRFVAFIMAALLVSIIIAVEPHAGGRLADTVRLPFHPNVIYLGLAAGLIFTGPGLLSLDGLLFGPRRSVTVTERYTEPLP